MSVEYTPKGSQVLLETTELKAGTAGSVLIPDDEQTAAFANANRERPQEGLVIAVGEGRYLENGSFIPMPIKVGEVVVFSRYVGADLKLDGKTYVAVDERDLLGWRTRL